MAAKRVRLYWGASYANSLDLNDQTNYMAATFGLFDGPEVEPVLQETVYSSPYDVRGKLKERVFSITVTVRAQPYSSTGITRRSDLMKAVMTGWPSNFVKVEVERAGQYMYLIARCTAAQESERGVFQLLFTAADPVFTATVFDPDVVQNLGTNPNSYPDAVVTYTGTAPTEPKLTLTVGGNGGVWRYYRNVYITNRSDYTLLYHPVCITLGNISANVGNANYVPHQGTKKFYVNGPAGSSNTIGYDIKDIRVESEGGARKIAWVRDTSLNHTDVRLWTVIYSLKPGETKVLRVFYGNYLCTADSETTYAPIKPMFNMYQSDNTVWKYGDFLPVWNQPQSRSMQWQPFVPDRVNMDWIKTPHPHFDSGAGNVPCAGGKVQYYNSTRGAAGVQLNVSVPVSRLNWGYRVSTNFRNPLVLHVNKADGREEDIWQWPVGDTYRKAAYVTLVEDIPANNPSYQTFCYVSALSRDGSTFTAGDLIYIQRDDSSWFRSTVTSVVTTPDPLHGNGYKINFTDSWSATVQVQASISQHVQQGTTGSVDQTYTAAEQPIAVAFVLRADQPTLTSGDWYYGGAEWCHIYFDSTKSIATGNAAGNNGGWSVCTEVDLTTSGFQVKGRFGNSTTGEYLNINTVCPTIGDKIVIDCAARTCQYIHYNGTGYDAPVNRFEALTFEAVRQYWVHLDPGTPNNHVAFIPDNQSLFTGLTVTITWPKRYF